MKQNQIAVQLYSLRDQMRDKNEIRSTLQALSAAGIKAVELAGTGEYTPIEFKALCDEFGLVICSSHESGEFLCEETAAAIDKMKLLGCKHVAYPYPHLPLKSVADLQKLAQKLNVAGRKLAAAGIKLAYHNHAIEFEKHDGKTGMDYFIDESSIDSLYFQPDMYWVQFGGKDPVTYCEKLTGRLTMIHVKEYGIIDNAVATPPAGQGNLDWPAIIAAAEAGGAEWFIIEQEGAGELTPFEAVVKSYEYLTTLVD
ncbi:MAG: TIM barrel protein [Bacillota bacterium]